MDVAVWRTAFASAAAEFLARIVGYLPTLAAGLGLLLLGYVVARGSRALVERLLTAGLTVVSRRAGIGRAVERTRMGPGFVLLLSRVIYWIVLTLFVAAAVERLELTIAISDSVMSSGVPNTVVVLKNDRTPASVRSWNGTTNPGSSRSAGGRPWRSRGTG